MMTFANRVVLITGAGQGIGRQLALQLAGAGAAIAAVDLDAELLQTLETDLAGKPVAAVVADVGERTALLKAVAGLEERLGPVDLLIANAGIGKEISALAFRADEIEAQVRVNLIGVANSVEAVLPGMLARKRGQLVAMSSLASYRGFPKLLGYCASKAAVNALFDGLRVELKPHGIDVTIVCPGWIRTRMTANVADRVPYLLEPQDAARRIIDAICRRRPYCLFPSGGAWRLRLLRWLPVPISDWMVERQLRRLDKK
jgi:short-subunit dehydrogenase